MDRGVHGPFYEAIHTEAGELEVQQAMPATVTDWLRICRANDVAFISSDGVRKGEATCANQNERRVDGSNDEAPCHCPLLLVAVVLFKADASLKWAYFSEFGVDADQRRDYPVET
jgi:hypothetical protein